MRAARRVKSAAERSSGSVAAISVAEDALGAAVEALRPGVREAELKGVFEERMCRLGTTTPAFEGTFCVIDADEPIRRFVSDRRMAEGDRVVLERRRASRRMGRLPRPHMAVWRADHGAA